ncbi:MAG: hypothetical protein JNL58_04940 [Planctomyces sp.]|nr:hypothetical protein [Planctomyces sp.]
MVSSHDTGFRTRYRSKPLKTIRNAVEKHKANVLSEPGCNKKQQYAGRSFEPRKTRKGRTGGLVITAERDEYFRVCVSWLPIALATRWMQSASTHCNPRCTKLYKQLTQLTV